MGEIISCYEKKNFNIVEMKMLKPTIQMANAHYEEHKEKVFFPKLIEFITESNLCALIIEGEDVVAMIRKINGSTSPLEAEVGSIRGKYATSKTFNVVHASDSLESAKREIKIWFPNLD